MNSISFDIPDSTAFPNGYKGGSVEFGVLPPAGVMLSALDRERGLERLEEWALNNILPGFIEGDYTQAYLQKEEVRIKISDADGKVVLDTFGW